MHPQQMVIYAVVGVLVIGLIAYRMRRMMTATPFDPSRAWIIPVLFIALSSAALVGAKPAGMDWVWVVGAAALGALIGYFRGRSIAISLEPATGRLMAQGSAAAMIFIGVLVAARYGLRYLLTTDATALSLRPIMADVLSAVMGAGVFVARGVEMGLRGRNLLQAHRANPTVTSTVTPDAP